MKKDPNAAYTTILDAEADLSEVKERYLRRFQWSWTCNTPGSFWIWRRDFADYDKQRHDEWLGHSWGPLGRPNAPIPYGVIAVSLDMAVAMTRATLDTDKDFPDNE